MDNGDGEVASWWEENMGMFRTLIHVSGNGDYIRMRNLPRVHKAWLVVEKADVSVAVVFLV